MSDVSLNFDILIQYIGNTASAYQQNIITDSNGGIYLSYISIDSNTNKPRVVVVKFNDNVRDWTYVDNDFDNDATFNVDYTRKNNVTMSFDGEGNILVSYVVTNEEEGNFFPFDSYANIRLIKLKGSGSSIFPGSAELLWDKYGDEITTGTLVNDTTDICANDIQRSSILSLRTDTQNNALLLYTINTVDRTPENTDFSYNVVVTKIDPNGNVVWINSDTLLNSPISQESTVYGGGIIADNNDDIYITYSTTGTIGVDASGVINDHNSFGLGYQIVVGKLDTNGNVLALDQHPDFDNPDPQTSEDLFGKLTLDFINGDLYLNTTTKLFKLDKSKIGVSGQNPIMMTVDGLTFGSRVVADDGRLFIIKTAFYPPPEFANIQILEVDENGNTILLQEFGQGLFTILNDAIYRGETNDIYLSYNSVDFNLPVSSTRLRVITFINGQDLPALLPRRRAFGMNYTIFEKKGYPRGLSLGYSMLGRRRR